MAVLSGLHVVFARGGGRGYGQESIDIVNLTSYNSQTIATDSVTTIVAAEDAGSEGGTVLIATPSANGWMSVGPSVIAGSAAADPRVYLRASDPPFTAYVKPGSKVSWKVDA